MSREAFEKWWPSIGQTIGKVAAWESWQAAQAQAVNQQLLEALQPIRFDVWADHYEEDRLWYEPCEDGSLLYYDQVVAAIAAAQEQSQ